MDIYGFNDNLTIIGETKIIKTIYAMWAHPEAVEDVKLERYGSIYQTKN